MLARTDQYLLLGQSLLGEHQPLEYMLTEPDGSEMNSFLFEKVGLLFGICRQSFECLRILLVPRADARWSRNLLTN